MTNGFWEGTGWEISNFGRISEVSLKWNDELLTYLLVFLKDEQGTAYTEKIASALETAVEDGLWKDKGLSGLKEVLEQVIQQFKLRTILTQEDLHMLTKGKAPVPEFYKQAIKNDIAKIILFG